MESAPGQTPRVLIQADAPPGTHAPSSRVWQMLTQVELIDRNGDAVKGQSKGTTDAAGARVSPSELGTASNYDTAGKKIAAPEQAAPH